MAGVSSYKKVPVRLSAREIFVYLTAAAANENDDESDDYPPNVVVAEKVAKTVIHNISSD